MSDDAQTELLQSVVPEVRLTITSGPHAGEQRAFRAYETLVVGRAPDCQWPVNKDHYFSRYHFSIEANPPMCVLKDLESSNGTIVRGARVIEVALQNGDEIVCGDTRFAVAIQQAPSFQSPISSPRVPVPDSYSTIERRLNSSPTFVGMAFPEYDVKRELGRGGMGVVYHAIHKPSKREVALKLILPADAARPESLQMFLREASLLSRLRHRRIVECLEIGVHDGCFYLAMEYVPTVDLKAILKSQEPPIQQRVVCGVVCRILEGLRFAHEQQVVHRDIKPANILVFRRERRLSAKLADFGLAKNYQNAGLSMMSEENQLKGTLPFMPPEQIMDCRYARPSCDIYAVGASMYYLLSGCFPFDFGKSRNAIALILNAVPVPIAARNPQVPQELAAVIARAMARDPSDRFSTAEELRRALLPFTKPIR